MACLQSRKIVFALAWSDHGSMIVNRLDYHRVDANRPSGSASDNDRQSF
jgi:hypothetical protein